MKQKTFQKINKINLWSFGRVLIVLISFSFLLFILFRYGYIVLLNQNDLKAFLELLITITGIVSAIIFSVLIQKYSEAKSKFEEFKKVLIEKQKRLILFRELCHESMNSYDIWRDVGYEHQLNYNTMVEKLHKSNRSSYPLDLYVTIRELGDGYYQGYHKTKEAQYIFNKVQLANLADKINTVWYLLDDSGKRAAIIDFLSNNKEKNCLVWDAKWIELLANKIYKSEFHSHFTSIDYWRETAGEIWETCNDMFDLYEKLENISTYLKVFKMPLLLIFLTGLALPLLILMFNYNVPFYVMRLIAYMNVFVFLGALLLFYRSVKELLTDNWYKKLLINNKNSNLS